MKKSARRRRGGGGGKSNHSTPRRRRRRRRRVGEKEELEEKRLEATNGDEKKKKKKKTREDKEGSTLSRRARRHEMFHLLGDGEELRHGESLFASVLQRMRARIDSEKSNVLPRVSSESRRRTRFRQGSEFDEIVNAIYAAKGGAESYDEKEEKFSRKEATTIWKITWKTKRREKPIDVAEQIKKEQQRGKSRGLKRRDNENREKRNGKKEW